MEGTHKLVPFASIVVDEDVVTNARADWSKDIRSLASNIWDKGLLNPITVSAKDKKNVLVAGFRRFAAIASLKDRDGFEDRFGKVPVVVVEGDQKALQQFNLIENLQRTDLTPAEQAIGMERLAELGMTQKETATMVGKTQSYVSQLLKLTKKLVEPAWNEFTKGNISVTDALALAEMDEKEQLEKMGIYEESMAGEDEEEDAEGKPKKAKKSKAKETKRKAREAILPGSRVKFEVTAKKAKAILESIEGFGINPRHEKDSYVDGVKDTLAGLLGEKAFPFETAEPAKPKAKKGRPKKEKAEEVDDEVVDDEVIEEEDE